MITLEKVKLSSSREELIEPADRGSCELHLLVFLRNSVNFLTILRGWKFTVLMSNDKGSSLNPGGVKSNLHYNRLGE